MSDDFEKQYDDYFKSSGEVEPEAESDSEEQQEIEVSSETHEENEPETDNGESDNLDDTPTSGDDDDVDNEDEESSSKKNDISYNLKMALKEERTKRQESDKKMQLLEEQFNQTRKALESLLTPQQQEHIPDYEEDPLGYIKWQQDKSNERHQQTEQFLKQQNESQQAYQYAVSLNNQYLADKEQAVKENPDFEKAANFLQDSVINEYRALGLNDAEINQRLTQDKLGLLETAKNLGIKSTDMIVNIAKARGFIPNKSSENTSKLDNIKKGLEKSKSLGSLGDTHNKKLSLKDISKLSDKAFDKMWSDYKSGNLSL